MVLTFTRPQNNRSPTPQTKKPSKHNKSDTLTLCPGASPYCERIAQIETPGICFTNNIMYIILVMSALPSIISINIYGQSVLTTT